MEWINCKERLPIEMGDILVLINNKILVGKALAATCHGYIDENVIIFFINFQFINDKNSRFFKKKATGGYWYKPDLYAEVTHWLELPKLPEKKAIVNNESN